MTQEKEFLEKLAATFIQASDKGSAPDIMVFPNRRASSTFKRRLTELSSKAMLLPLLETIETYSARVSGFKQLSKREMLIPVYHITKEIGSDENFEQYLKWAPTLIDDFNDLDDYLADGAALFNYLSEARAIEMWNPSGQALTDFQKRFMEFWKSLPQLYLKVKEFNLKKQRGTAGQVKRMAAESLKLKKQFLLRNTWFAGFNALTPSEAALIEQLAENSKVKIFWDADRYYLSDFRHEAGKYIRYYHDKWKDSGISEILLHDGWKNPNKKITLLGASGLSGQALAATETLVQLQNENPDKKIALVAADMQIEQALSHVLPERIELNFSPGLPLSTSPIAAFIILAWDVWLKNDPTKGFRSEELRKLLRNPLASQMGGTFTKGLLELLDSTGKPWIGKGDLNKHNDNKLCLWLNSFSSNKILNTRSWTENLRNLLFEYYHLNFSKKPSNKLGIALALGITAMDKFLSETKDLPENEPDPFTAKRWVQSVIKEHKIPVEGNPAAAVQVMGLLESRNLDFDIVILAGANEGQLPATAGTSGFIPYDIKQQFGLPGRSDRESVFSYHFYRMLQHPEEIVLIYNTEVDTMGSGEKSRYLQQLEFEWPGKVPGAKIKKEIRKIIAPPTNERIVYAPKNQWVQEAIIKCMEKGLSPTSLNSFRACSLQFYFKHILRLRKPKEISGVLEADTLGSALHYTFEQIYKPCKNKFLDTETLNTAKKNIKELVETGIREKNKHIEIHSGKNLLLKEMSEALVRKVLDFDIGRIENGQKIKIISVEHPLEFTITADGKTIKFIGNADRIEEADNETRVIDYKTGKTESKEIKLKTIADLDDEHYDKAFQLIMYSWLYGKMNKSENIKAGILAVKKPSEGILPLIISEEKEIFTQFENYLLKLISDLMDEDKTFSQTSEPKNCKYCDFALFCGRQ
jgi:ATP-dependent helicase/nuclease subunit B